MALVTRKTTTASTNASPSHHNVDGDDADTSTLRASAATDTTLSSSCHSSPYRSATRGVLLRLQHARREVQGQQHADSSNKTSSSNTVTKDGLTSTTTTTKSCTTASSPVLVEPTRQPAPRPRSMRRTTTTIRQSELRSGSRTREAEKQPQCSALSAPSSLVSTLNSTNAVHTMPTTAANDVDSSSSSKGRRSGTRDRAVTAAAVTTHDSPMASTTITSSTSSNSVAATVGGARHDAEVDQSQGSRCSRDRPSPMVVRQQDTRTHSHLPRSTHKSDEDEKQKDKGGKQAVVAAVQCDDIVTSCKATTTDVVDEADVVVMHAEPHSVRDADTTDSVTRYSAPRSALQALSQSSHSAAATRFVDSDSPHHHHGCAEDHEGDSACHATCSHHTLPVMTNTTTTTSSDVIAVDMSHTHAVSTQRDKSTEQGTPHNVSRMKREVNEILRTRTTTVVAEDLVAGEKNTTCSSNSGGCVAAPVMPHNGDRDTASRHTTLHTTKSSSSNHKKEVQGSAVHDTAYGGSGAVSELRIAHTPETVALPCHSPHLARHPSSQQQQQQPTSHLTHTTSTTTTTGNDDVAVSQPPSAHRSPHCLSSLDRWRVAQQTQTHKTITTTTTTTTNISDEDERKEEDNVLLVLPSSATPHTPLPCPLTAASSSPSTSHASSTTTTTPAAKTTLADSVRQPRHSAMPHAVCESTACDVLHPSLASPCLQRTPVPTHINTTTTTTATTGDGMVNEGVVHSSLERWRRTQAAAGVTTTTARNSGRSSVAVQSSRASQHASARQRSSMPTSPHPPTSSHQNNSSRKDGRVKQHDSAEAVVLHSSAEGFRSEGLALVSQDNDYTCNTLQDVKTVHAECITNTKEEQPIQGKTRDDMKEHGSEGEEREKEAHDVSALHTPLAVSPRVNVTLLPASVLVHDSSHTSSNVRTSQAEAASSLLVPHAMHANDRTPHNAATEQSNSHHSNDNKEDGDVRQVGNVRLGVTALAQQTTHITRMDNHNDNMHNTIAKVETGLDHALQQASQVAHERESPRLPSHTTTTTTTTTSITDTHSPSPPPAHSTTTTTTHSDTQCDGRHNRVKKNSNNAAAVVKGDGCNSVSAQSPSLPSTSVVSVAGASARALPKSQYVHDLQAFITRLEQQLSRASFAEAADTAAAAQHTSPKYEESKSSTNTRGHEEEHVLYRKSTLHDGSSSSDDAMAARGQHLPVSDMTAVKDAARVGMHGSVAAHVSSLPRHHPATCTSSTLLLHPERTSGSMKSSTACTAAAVIEPRNTVSTTTTAAVPESEAHILQQQLHAPRAAVRTMTTGSAAVPSLAATVADGEATRAPSHTDTHAEGTTLHTTTTTTSYSATTADMDSVTSETDEDVPFWCDRLLLYDDEEKEEGECRGQSRHVHTTASPCSNDAVAEAIRRVPRLDLSALYIPDDAFLAERYRIPMPTCETRPDEARLRLWHEVGIASVSRNNSSGGAAVVSENNMSVVCAKSQQHHKTNNKRAVEAMKNDAVEEKKDGEVHTAVHATTMTSVVEAGSIMERLRQHRAQREQRRLASVVAEDTVVKSEDVSSVKEEEDIAGGQTMTRSIAAENEKACIKSDTSPPAPPLRASQQQRRDKEDTRRERNASVKRITAAVVATSAVQLKDKLPLHNTTTTTTTSNDDVGAAERTSATLHHADKDRTARCAALLSHHTVHDTTDLPVPRITTTTTALSLRMEAEGDKVQQNEADSHAVALQTGMDDDDGVATAPHRMSSSHTNDAAHAGNDIDRTMCQQQYYVHSKDGFESELSGHYGHHFSDASDALDGGRGVEQERRTRMRSLRVQLLLLTCQEQRGRKSIWAEEAIMIERMCRHAYDISSQSEGCSSMSPASLRVTLSP